MQEKNNKELNTTVIQTKNKPIEESFKYQICNPL